jgi:hypothetical protein
MNINVNPGASGYPWMKVFCAVGLSALLIACGSGGGSPGSPKPPFEKIGSFNGVPAVIDNTTGNVWAAQLGPINLQGVNTFTPQAEALLAVAELPDAVRQEYFAFVDGKVIKAVNEGLNSIWVVDFGLEARGGLRTEAIDENTLNTWVLLQQGSLSSNSLNNLLDGTVQQGRLQWSICTLGTSYNNLSGRCVASPARQTYSFADAQTEAANSSIANKTGWRLPTKQELQTLLLLANAPQNKTMLSDVFLNADILDNSNPLEYWTSSVYSQNNLRWVVDFVGSNDGGVRAIDPNTTSAYVRLVRDL